MPRTAYSRLWPLAILGIVGLFGQLAAVEGKGQVPGVPGGRMQPVDCYRGAPCAALAPQGCIPLPTSLPAIDFSQPDKDGWQPAPGSSGCGVRRRWLFWVVPCGPPLGGAACVPT